MRDREDIGLAAEMACLLEVCAPKPGNVTRQKDFGDTCFEDFIVSAAAIGPAFRNVAHVTLGRTILEAIRATRRLVGTNTNLGMVLLLAPLAKAAILDYHSEPRAAVGEVLHDLTVEDARLAYEAIRLANPGGMGRVDRFDVNDAEVDITLLEAMRQAQEWDVVAREYATDFAITFELGLPGLKGNLERGAGLLDAVVQTYLSILARIPDTLIARKKGLETARRVSAQAGRVLELGGIYSKRGREAIEEFDLALRDEKHLLNPGATADLTAAFLFVHLLQNDPISVFAP